MISVQLLPSASTPAQARAAIGPLRARLSADDYEEAILLASELVTNSVRHAALEEDETIALSAEIRGDLLRIEVTDRGRGFLPRFGSDNDNWGLRLAEQLSDRWGITRAQGRTTVWLEKGVATPA
jgi:serine/threonine-protein kinase RsbW